MQWQDRRAAGGGGGDIVEDEGRRDERREAAMIGWQPRLLASDMKTMTLAPALMGSQRQDK